MKFFKMFITKLPPSTSRFQPVTCVSSVSYTIGLFSSEQHFASANSTPVYFIVTWTTTTLLILFLLLFSVLFSYFPFSTLHMTIQVHWACMCWYKQEAGCLVPDHLNNSLPPVAGDSCSIIKCWTSLHNHSKQKNSAALVACYPFLIHRW